jgi:hypothetical protein
LEGDLLFWSSLEDLLRFCEFGQRFLNVDETGNEPPDISSLAQAVSYFMFFPSVWPYPYGFQFLEGGDYPLG